jgi:BirA family transcriptional regulator, biotin operon repressor / biotin---[acetyl-CoA-carboxylase] ligase
MDAATVQREMRTALHTHPWADQLHVFDTLSSSNDEALECARTGAPHGTVIVALHQTAGRGRQGRVWASPSGDSLCLSVLLRAPSPIPTFLTMKAGLAVHRSLTALTGLPLHIKWPNDILWESKKLCGILCEGGLHAQHGHFMVIGIGINLNQERTNFPTELRDSATSLRLLTGDSWSLTSTGVDLLFTLEAVLNESWQDVLTAWKSHCISLGGPVRISTPQGMLHGTLVDVDDTGAILLQSADGGVTRLVSAEIL